MTEEESESESDEDMTITVEYTPMELIAGLQLLDYMDLRFLEEGVPMGVIGVHRQKLLEALLKENVYSEVELAREEMMEEFKNSFDNDKLGKNGFQ